MKYIHVHALFLMSFFHISCGGQDQKNIAQDNISKGLYTESEIKEADSSRVPNSMVRNVRLARNGDILIASYLGVFRYDVRLPDGHETSFTNLTSKIISPRTSSFWDVLEDRKGNLWFASKDSGVYYYEARMNDGDALATGQASLTTDKAGLQHFTTKDGLASNRVVKMYEDKAGNIWFATGGGASRYDGKSLTTGEVVFRNFTTKDGLSNNDLTTIMEDKTGRLWFGTRGEPCFYDPSLPDGQGEKFTVFKNDDGKAFHNVWSIIEDNKGNIWFGDDDGLWRYDGRSFTHISQRGALAIIQDRKGNIWTAGKVNPEVWALSRYDAQSLYNKIPIVTEIKSGERMDYLAIVEANNGSIWFGSHTGVYRYDAGLPEGQGKAIKDFKNK